jgi:uncharacterized Tic20 family protein
MNITPTTEDRIWAVLAHLSALAFGMGILLPIIGWSEQRRKSTYASFQCLQALGYQSVGFTIWILSYLVFFVGGIILLAAIGSFSNPNDPGSIQTPGMILFFLLVFGLFALYFVLPIIAATACALGKDFHYPILGNRLSRYLGYERTQHPDEQAWLDEDRENRWVAAMGHFSILIMLWGMLAPLTAWILQGKNSSFLKFQSIQTLVYQAFTTILYFIGILAYLFGMVLLLSLMQGFGTPDFSSSSGIVRFMSFGALFLLAILLLLFVPLLHILGQWAGYRVLKGDNYRYPLLGRQVEKWMANQTMMSVESDLHLKGTS